MPIGRTPLVSSLIVVFALLGTVNAQSQSLAVEDLYIDHVSTVPANEGEMVRLFARRYHGDATESEAVIAVSAGTLTADASFGLDYEGYNYLTYLAGIGFDVFAADHTGYGFSPRPMMDDPCNVDPEVQAELLVPHPLSEPCEASYPHPLVVNFTDVDELDTFVDYVRELTGDTQVSLIGWSRGTFRVGGYAALHPEKVERVVMIEPRGVFPDPPTELPDELPAGFPINLQDLDAFVPDRWSPQEQCEGFADYEGVIAEVARKMATFDPVAAEWGTASSNLYRAPTYISNQAGWSLETIQQIGSPTLIIRGLASPRPGIEDLYEDLTMTDKIMVEFECGTHWVIWEKTHPTVRDAIAGFLRAGTVEGQNSGVLRVDRNGEFQ